MNTPDNDSIQLQAWLAATEHLGLHYLVSGAVSGGLLYLVYHLTGALW